MMQFGWNPLLGVPPASLYETLEKRAAASDGLEKLAPGPGPLKQRWTFRHYGDGLVHNLLALRHTKYWQHEREYIPVEAITECGVLALLRSETGWPVAYDSGMHVPDEPLTCLRCLSGVEREGVQYRETQKAAQFAQAYGMSPEKVSKMLNTNQPNMQQMPRKRR
jgi:hypothetical protein